MFKKAGMAFILFCVLLGASNGQQKPAATGGDFETLMAQARKLSGVEIAIKDGKPERVFRAQRVGNEPGNPLEAAKALQEALRLKPDDCEARLIFMQLTIDRFLTRTDEAREQGRDLIARAQQAGREAIAKAPDAMWADLARLCLAQTLALTQEESSLPELERIEREISPESKPLIRATRGTIMERMVKEGKLAPKAYAPYAEEELMRDLDSRYEIWKRSTGDDPPWVSLNSILHAWRFDEAATAAHVNRILPKLRQKYPGFDIPLLGAAIGLQERKDSEVVTEAVKVIQDARKRSATISAKEGKMIIERLCDPLAWWGCDNSFSDLVVTSYEATGALGGSGTNAPAADEQRRVRYFYALARLGRKEEALKVADSFGTKTVQMSSEGPWGDASQPFVAWKEAARLRSGKETVEGAFEIGKPAVTATFPMLAVDSRNTWLASLNSVYKAKLGEMKSSRKIELSQEYIVTAIALTAEHAYFGTGGGGLVRLDEKTDERVTLLKKDGLLIDYISALHVAEDRLWIGYGTKLYGGVGALDLKTGKIISITPPLPESVFLLRNEAEFNLGLDPKDGPPRRAVTGIGHRGSDIFLAVAGKGVQRYSTLSNSWETWPVGTYGQPISCIVANEGFVVAGSVHPTSWGSRPGVTLQLGGLSVKELGKTNWEEFTSKSGLSNDEVSALALDGNDLWIGGVGFISRMDLGSRAIKNTASVEETVHQLVVTPEWIWAAAGNRMYRFARPR